MQEASDAAGRSETENADQPVVSFDTEAPTFLKKIQRFLHDNPTMVPVLILILSVLAFGAVAVSGSFPPSPCR